MPDSLALALQARQNDLEKENAWLGAGKQIMGLDSVNPMASVGSNLAAALIKGLGGAAMQNLGQWDVGQQLATDEQILNNIKYGRQPAQGTIWQERYEPYLNSYAQELAEQQKAQQQRMQNLYLQAQLAAPTFKTIEEDGQKKLYISKPVDRLAEALLGKTGGQGGSGLEQAGFKEVSSTPTNPNTIETDIYKRQADAGKALEAFDGVLETLQKIPADEGWGGAMIRSAKVNAPFGLGRNTDAAQLDRELKSAIATALKPLFPGAISDTERLYMQKVLGDQEGVSRATLENIFLNAKERVISSVNTPRQQAVKAGFTVRMPELESETITANQKKDIPLKLPNESKADFIKRIRGR